MTRGLSLLIAMVAAMLTGPVDRAGAAEPGPAEDRITVEANTAPTTISTSGTRLLLCVQNVNRRTSANQMLVPDDTFVFRSDPICGTFTSASTGCPADIAVFASGLADSDFNCSIAGDAVTLRYDGGGIPKPLNFEEGFCFSVDFTPAFTSSACVLDYRFTPRTTTFGSFSPEGIGRINQAQAPSFFTLTVGGGAGTTGPTGPAGPAGPAGADGVTGPTGPIGNDGPTGAVGPGGPAGPAGADGATGAAGPAGADGADGADGATGAAGPAGADGADGADGATGAAGPAGADGADGADGATGAAGPAGAAGADGADGATGAIGGAHV